MSDDRIELATEGQSSWKIWLHPNAGAVEHFAAEELRKYIRALAGISLQDSEDADTAKIICLCLRKDLPNCFEVPSPKAGHDGYSLCVGKDSVVIAGDNPRGVLYGVYHWLELLGCRWYHAAIDPKDPEIVPLNPNLSSPICAISEASPIEDRFYWMGGLAFWVNASRAIPQLDWAAKNRYNGLSWQCVADNIDSDLAAMRSVGILDEMAKRGLALHGPGHCFTYFLPNDKHFQQNPEWFGFRDGKRQPHGKTWPATNFCLSSAEAREEFIKNVEVFVQRYPEIKRLDMLPLDGGKTCECEACRQHNATDLYVDFYNQISDRVEKIAPDIVVDAVPGYCPIERPPERIVPNGKWQGLYAHWGRNHAESYNDPNYGRRQNLLVWASHFKRFWICSYYAANSHQPFFGPPFLHAIEGDVAFMVEQGITGTLILECPYEFWWNNSFNIRLGALHAYYYPLRRPIDELRDYVFCYYGPLAGPLLFEFYSMLGAKENLEKVYRSSRGEAEPYDVIYLQEMQSMVKRAAQLTESDPVCFYRVQKLAAAMEMAICLAPTRRSVIEAEKAVEQCLKGEAEIEDARTKITQARDCVVQIQTKSKTLAEDYAGVVATDWFDSWILSRTYTDPLNAAEKRLVEICS